MIDTTANVVLAQIVVGAAPTGISFRPAAGALPDRVYVANRDGSNGGNPLGTVSIIDPTTNAVVATVGNIAVAPIGIVAAPSGDVVATTRDNTGDIYQINGATNAITTSLSAGANTEPHGVAIRPDGARLYVATVGSGAVPRTGATKVYDGAGALVTNIVGTAPVDLAVNPSGSRLYVANYDSASVQVVDTTTNAVLSTVAVGSNPWGIAVAATNDPDTVPTLSEWALILFGSLMAGTMVWYQRRRV